MSAAIVRCFSRFSDVREWSADGPQLEPGAVANGWHDVDGVFVGDRDTWTAVVRHEGELLITRPGDARPLSTVELVEIVPCEGHSREARLRFKDGDIWSVEYAPLAPLPEENDPTPFTEPGDFDFGEYLRSLVLDLSRQDRVFRRAGA